MTSPSVPYLQRFEDGYIPEPNSGCWLWIKALNLRGYHRSYYWEGKTRKRRSWRGHTEMPFIEEAVKEGVTSA